MIVRKGQEMTDRIVVRDHKGFRIDAKIFYDEEEKQERYEARISDGSQWWSIGGTHIGGGLKQVIRGAKFYINFIIENRESGKWRRQT